MVLVVTKATLHRAKRYGGLEYELRVDTKINGEQMLVIPREIMQNIVKEYKLLVKGKSQTF